MAEGLTAIFVVNIPAIPGVGVYGDVNSISDCAAVLNGMIEVGTMDVNELMETATSTRAYVHPAHDLDPTLPLDCCDHVLYNHDVKAMQCQKCGRVVDDGGAVFAAPVLRLVAEA